MNYTSFRDLIRAHLQQSSSGMTWKELRDQLGLTYERPCPEWIRWLERDVGLLHRVVKLWTSFIVQACNHGGRDNGAPEDCGGGYNAAYLLDPDGNNIEAGIRMGA